MQQGGPQAEVRGARLHPLPAVRPAALGLQEVRPVPDLRARGGPPRRAARRDQEQLVTAMTLPTNVPARPAGARRRTERMVMLRSATPGLQLVTLRHSVPLRLGALAAEDLTTPK